MHAWWPCRFVAEVYFPEPVLLGPVLHRLITLSSPRRWLPLPMGACLAAAAAEAPPATPGTGTAPPLRPAKGPPPSGHADDAVYDACSRCIFQTLRALRMLGVRHAAMLPLVLPLALDSRNGFHCPDVAALMAVLREEQHAAHSTPTASAADNERAASVGVKRPRGVCRGGPSGSDERLEHDQASGMGAGAPTEVTLQPPAPAEVETADAGGGKRAGPPDEGNPAPAVDMLKVALARPDGAATAGGRTSVVIPVIPRAHPAVFSTQTPVATHLASTVLPPPVCRATWCGSAGLHCGAGAGSVSLPARVGVTRNCIKHLQAGAGAAVTAQGAGANPPVHMDYAGHVGQAQNAAPVPGTPAIPAPAVPLHVPRPPPARPPPPTHAPPALFRPLRGPGFANATPGPGYARPPPARPPPPHPLPPRPAAPPPHAHMHAPPPLHPLPPRPAAPPPHGPPRPPPQLALQASLVAQSSRHPRSLQPCTPQQLNLPPAVPASRPVLVSAPGHPVLPATSVPMYAMPCASAAPPLTVAAASIPPHNMAQTLVVSHSGPCGAQAAEAMPATAALEVSASRAIVVGGSMLMQALATLVLFFNGGREDEESDEEEQEEGEEAPDGWPGSHPVPGIPSLFADVPEAWRKCFNMLNDGRVFIGERCLDAVLPEKMFVNIGEQGEQWVNRQEQMKE